MKAANLTAKVAPGGGIRYSSDVSFEQLKAEAATLTPEQRRELIGHLLALGRKDDAAFKRMLSEKIDDKNPDHWVTLDELRRRVPTGDSAE